MQDRPSTVPWPPLIYGAAIIAALLMQQVAPPVFERGQILLWIGVVMAVAGLGLDVAAMLALSRAKTTILPHRGAERLVTTGPFRFTRNPIYMGNTLMIAGLGLATGALLLVPAALIASGFVHNLAVKPEEAHLEAKFGAEWTDYAARTPRWLPFSEKTA